MAPELVKAGGSIISGFASGKAAEQASKDELKAQKAEYDRSAFNYGYKNIYPSKKAMVPSSQEAWYQYAPLDYSMPESAGLLGAQMASKQNNGGRYQIVNGEVVFVGG